MRTDPVVAVYGFGALVALFAVPAALLKLLENVGPRPPRTSSRAFAALMTGAGVAVCILSLLPPVRYVPGVPIGAAISLLGASELARDARFARWLDRLAVGLMLLVWLVLWLRSRG